MLRFRILIEDALMPTCQHGGPPSQPARTPEERARAQRVSGMKGELEGVGWAAIWVLRSSFGPSLRAQGGERPSPNETAAKSGSSSVVQLITNHAFYFFFLKEMHCTFKFPAAKHHQQRHRFWTFRDWFNSTRVCLVSRKISKIIEIFH